MGKYYNPNVSTGGLGSGTVLERLNGRPWLNRHPSAGAAKVPRCQAAKPPAPTPARLAARMRVYILGKPPNPEPRRLRAVLLRHQVEEYYHPVTLGTIPVTDNPDLRRTSNLTHHTPRYT